MGTGWDNAAEAHDAQRPKSKFERAVDAMESQQPTVTLNQGLMIERLIEASHLRDAAGVCYFCTSSGANRDGWCRRVRRVEVTATDVNLMFGDR